MVVACYPTLTGNPRPDFPLPTGKVVPHMQTGSERLFADDTARYPMLVFSHGYAGSPLANDYLDVLSESCEPRLRRRGHFSRRSAP